MFAKTGLAVVAMGALVTTSALAQTTPTPPAGSSRVIPEKQAPLKSGRSDSLSSKLDKTGGVIKPSGDVDPGMRAPAPDPTPHSTPVIPPSATGGDSAK